MSLEHNISACQGYDVPLWHHSIVNIAGVCHVSIGPWHAGCLHGSYQALTGFVGDRQILFADKVLKFTATGKMKRRILIITDYAVYIIDPETSSLKRRITLAAVEKLYLSTLCDNFFVIGIPTEYDILMASTRKTEIVTVLVEATKNASNFELDVIFKNRFAYNRIRDMWGSWSLISIDYV